MTDATNPPQYSIEDLQYEIKVLKGKLDEKQKVNIGLTPSFSFDPKFVKTHEDFVKLITTWGFHRGNWQNFIQTEDLDPWIDTLQTLQNQLIYTQVLELIGEDEKYPKLPPNSGMYNPTMITRNQIRQELRAKAKAKFMENK